MARLESIAIGGYYPTPEHLVPRIAGLLTIPATEESAWTPSFAACDPCAGDGAAVMEVARLVFKKRAFKLFAAEMEATRFKAMEARRGEDISWAALEAVHADAFRVAAFVGDGLGLLWLNPPYDYDADFGRLEEKFLDRFTPLLGEDGVLVFIVPHAALKASATTLAREYRALRAFRFPGQDFDAYKQVVVIASKREGLFAADPVARAAVCGWAAHPELLPELPELDAAPPVATIPAHGVGIRSWSVVSLDAAALLSRFVPWHVSDRGGRLLPTPGIVPDRPLLDMLTRTYPLAMPPRPAHIAAGIAAGVFNGARIEPDDPTAELPALLVKGAFDREFVTVDERENRDGEKTGEIQVQQPKLVVTVLDLDAKSYVVIKNSAERTGATRVADMTIADLLLAYGRSLMRCMIAQCPVMHDPSDPSSEIPLPSLGRSLFAGQRHPVMATVKLLGGLNVSPAKRRGRAAFLLGEIGSGKSTVALAAASAIGARRVLVMCPPHLLDGWRDQVAAVRPDARVMVLSDVADVDAFAGSDFDGLIVAILSREAAKLGHAWVSVEGACPKCGGEVPPGDLAKTREHCRAATRRPALIEGRRDACARLAMALAAALLPALPLDPVVTQYVQGRHGRRLLHAYQLRRAGLDDEQVEALWRACCRWRLRSIALGIANLLLADATANFSDSGGGIDDALLLLCAAINDAPLTSLIAEELYEAASDDLDDYGFGANRRTAARKLALLLDPNSDEQKDLVARLCALPQERGGDDRWGAWRGVRRALISDSIFNSYAYRNFSTNEEGVRTLDGHTIGSPEAAVAALEKLSQRGRWSLGRPCGAPLFCAVPSPRRVPLATYLARRKGAVMDLFILDEGHEYAGEGSAQGFAAHRLAGLGAPTIVLTGSVMNGYADSLFANQWAFDPDFRAEFDRDGRQEFVRRFGYLKQLVEDRDQDGKVVSFGSMSDRVERRSRTIGSAPGVLPLFVLRYLLRLAVTLHKADLALDLPECREIVTRLRPTPELQAAYLRLQTALVQAIQRDRFSELSGKLWGQMAELPSYLDRATRDVGSTDGGGDYVIAYPASVGGDEVAREPGVDPSLRLPKEQWLVDTVEAELDEGRNVLVFAWHTALLPRLARIIESQLGERCAVLDADRVPARKRQDWIDREVIARKRRVLVVNPVAVQTGLNNLVYFATEVWMENPGCNAIIYRQAVGRVDRIGAKKETRIYFPIYEDTSQAMLHKLLMHKVGVSMSTDGLDADSALAAAGVGSGAAFDALAVGKQLYELIVSEGTR